MADLPRYLLWQLPGWALGAGVAAWLVWGLGLPGWLAGVGLAALVLKDLLLFPALRAVFRPSQRPQPVGARGESVERLAPAGYVRVRGELWRAESHGPAIPAGRPVLVREARGLTLIVEETGGARGSRGPDGDT
jgi:membrane protein implicated in regulation of membrane protease activity